MDGLRFGRILAILGVGSLAACSGNWGGNPEEQQYPKELPGHSGHYDPSPDPNKPDPSIFGDGGLTLFGGDAKKKSDDGGGASVGVNAILWRASLETLSFMPLASADPFGGTIITDWYSSPDKPGERMKATVYILDRRLTADALKVSLFRQTRDASGQWADAPVAPETVTQLENSILTKARQIRVQTLGQ